MKLFCYRYMWLTEDSENLNIKILVDIDEGHQRFIENLKNTDKIRSLVRVYQYEIDLEKIECYESLYENKKVGVENETCSK